MEHFGVHKKLKVWQAGQNVAKMSLNWISCAKYPDYGISPRECNQTTASVWNTESEKRGRTVSCDLNEMDFFFFISYHSCIRILSIYTIFEVEHSDADLAPAWVLYYSCLPLLVVCLIKAGTPG